MILVTILLAVLIAVESNVPYPPCVFNPLCTCSRSDTHLGVVTCVDIPLARLPSYLNRSKLNSLQLINNGLQKIDPNFLSGTGLHMLKISGNPLYDVEADALRGLETSLRDLELSYAKLIQVPADALRHMQKLQTLNLSGNDIADIGAEHWVNVRGTLEILILRENGIGHVPSGAFEKFTKLKILDLSENVLVSIDSDAFFADSVKLTHLYLADNQLRSVPYAELRSLRSLKILDLNRNAINKLGSTSDGGTSAPSDTKFSLHSLHLEYNNIRSLTTDDLENFSAINATYLRGNPITSIQYGVFQNVRVSELSLAECGLAAFDARILRGLEQILASLDLSANKLTVLDPNLFRHFTALRELKTLGNAIENFSVPVVNGNLLRLEVGGAERSNGPVFLHDINRIKSLISVTMSNAEIGYVAPQHFVAYGFGVEELRLVNTKTKSIYAQAFVHVRGIKILDLSNNQLDDVDENAFREIGHSLNALYLSRAFAAHVKSLPHTPLKHLNSLKLLDISFNSFEELPSTSFHSMYHLESVRVHDCLINVLKRETFQSEIHVRLKEVTFSFNRLRVIKSFTFSDLPELRYLNFEENLLQTIETRAFNNLNKLKWLYLRGNQIEYIEFDAFSYLPELELLDLTFNNLKNFDSIAVDEMVGSFTFLNLNLSFNEIQHLQTNAAADAETDIPDLNIKILDLSHNSIASVALDYFAPFENSLTHLYMSHNLLMNASHAVFGNLGQLQWLDFSSNRIRHLERDLFRDADKIQFLSFRHNDLHDLPPNIFHGMKNLRIVDLSENRLNFLPEYSFREDSLESISLARNQFVRIPFKSFISIVAWSVKDIDLSYNSIATLHAPEFWSHFKSLISLNVSGNVISLLERQTFSSLTGLLNLDLSHNQPLQFVDERQPFDGLQESLRVLGLKNTTNNYVPHLPFRKLTILYLSDNNLTTITPEVVVNVTSIRVLDLSRNNFTTIPVVILSMKNLKLLNLSRNNIHILSNNSLLSGFEELRELDISDLPLQTFETGALNRLSSLRTIHISTYRNLPNLKIPKIFERNYGLRSLHLHVSGRTLKDEVLGYFPKNLREIVIHGSQLQDVDSGILSGFSSPQLSVTFHGTKLETLQDTIFQNVKAIVNITVNVQHNNLKYFHNPSTSSILGLFGRTFLVDLKISHNLWPCTCDIGWVETWNRVKRQLFCRYYDFSASKHHHLCLQSSDDSRMTRCADGQSLLHTMKTELECQWSRGSQNFKLTSWYSVTYGFVWCIVNRYLLFK